MATAMFLSNNVQGARDVDAVTFDAIENFKVSQTAKVTNNPVEDGSTIADHYVLDPKTVSFRGVVTPWNFSGKGSDFTPLQLIQKFESTMVGKEFFDLYLSTDLQSIRNCLITRFEYDREAKEGQSIVVSVDVQQILLVPKASQADITDLTLAPDVSEQGQTEADGGDGSVSVNTSFVNKYESAVSIGRTLTGVQ